MGGDIRELRRAVLDLHAALLEAEKRQYERDHGRIESSGYALKLAIEHPSFAWIRPLAEFIVALDELEEGDAAPSAEQRGAVLATLKSLIGAATGEFASRYREMLQQVPEVLVAHGKVSQLLGGNSQLQPQTPT